MSAVREAPDSPLEKARRGQSHRRDENFDIFPMNRSSMISESSGSATAVDQNLTSSDKFVSGLPGSKIFKRTSSADSKSKTKPLPSPPLNNQRATNDVTSNPLAPVSENNIITNSDSATSKSEFTFPPSRQRVLFETTLPLKRSNSSASFTSSGFSASIQALRKKIGSEINKKRPGAQKSNSTGNFNSSSRKNSSKNLSAPAAGSVAGLRPTIALTVPDYITVAEASQLCAAKRADCVLVVDQDESLSGIFTAKDLAYRVVAEGLDPRNTTVASIMTKNPMVTRDSSSATEALEIMVKRGFRHLPVCNDSGDISGLLDITKVFHDALDKVERSHGASQKLYSALEGVQSELGESHSLNPQAAAMANYVNALRAKMALPDLASVLDMHTAPATVGVKTTVAEAARIMKDCHTTAVCVMEQPGVPTSKIAGIFTSKDVVLRVIAAGLDPNRCAVVRVMTPHPDVALPSLTIQEALRKMNTGHYLNLPVVDEQGCLVGIVDVLKLTYATLEQINTINTDGTSNDGEAETGPMWSKFFNSIQQSGPNSTGGNDQDSESVVSGSAAPESLSTNRIDVEPSDSASAVGAETPLEQPSLVGTNAENQSALLIDDGTYIFKFNSPSGMTHRFQARYDSLSLLREIVSGKLSIDPFFQDKTKNFENFILAYTDKDTDTVQMSADDDVKDAVAVARAKRMDRVVLILQGEWITKIEPPLVVERAEPVLTRLPSNNLTKKEFDIKDYLIPLSAGAVGVCVVLGFLLSRGSKK